MENIGFIGLGIMGRPMATNLADAGFPLTVLDHKVEAMNELATHGAGVAETPRAVAEASDIVITMLTAPPNVEEVMFGPDGVLQGLRAGGLLIDMTTVYPSLARRICDAARELNGDALDAPVSGGQVGAQNATLSIMVGGSEASYERALPVLQTLGKNIIHMGDAGAGQLTKAANQIVVGVTIEAVSEALVLAAKAGVDPARVRQALLGGFAQSRVLELHGQRMLQRNFRPGGKIAQHRRDLGIALATAAEVGVSLPTTAMTAEMMNAVIAQAGPDVDQSAILLAIEMLSDFREGVGEQVV